MIGLLLAKKIASMFLIIAMGFTIVKAGVLKTEDSKPISMIALYLITPCMIISSFQIELTEEIRHGFLLSMLAAVIILCTVIALTTVFRKAARFDSVEIVSIVYTNSGNLIIPIVLSLFGKEWVVYLSAYNIVLNFLMWTHAKGVLSGDKKPDLRKILLNPNMIAIFIGLFLLFSGVQLPEILADAVDSVGSIVGPACMLVTGMLMAGMNAKKVLSYKRAWVPILLRLVAVPLLAITLYKVLHLASLTDNGMSVLTITVMACAAPSASSVVQMAQTFQSDAAADYAAAVNVVGTLLCIITLPIMVTLFTMG